MNTFGNLLRLTSFGESHGAGIGGVIDGFPAGVTIDMDFIRQELSRRRPGQSAITTGRKEKDEVEILSGVFEGRSTGCPIGFFVRNEQQHSSDYDNLRNVFRPSHADYTYYKKYGLRDHRGGGRSSARETIARVVAGALAKLALKEIGINIQAYTSQVGTIKLEKHYQDLPLEETERYAVRCPDEDTAKRMEELILETKRKGDTVGGIVNCIVKGCPVGLGEPVFGKLHAALGSAMLSINAAKGFDYGDGFSMAEHYGSEMNDLFLHASSKSIQTVTNHSGGIQGGISNGEDIFFRVAFKPVATVLFEQKTINAQGTEIGTCVKGRHDPCVVPRAVPIVEAMAAMTILDFWLLRQTNRISKRYDD